MEPRSPTRVQLCGPLVVEWRGERLEARLPGRQGRLVFAYLVLHRSRATTRDALVDAVWPGGAPPAAETALAALLSKLRRVLGADHLTGRSEVRVVLPEGATVDLELARARIHDAESAVAGGDWPRAWAAAQTALFIASRGFLPTEEADWVEECRREVDVLHLRALEANGRACLGIGGAEDAAAVRVGRELVRRSPLRESGHLLLMRALVASGNRAEALIAYESVRLRLREDLGVSPGAALQDLHGRLLRDG
ncbi:MAG TPA: BTAD domain-containing putative transcriptional regulator [Miltoncostaea sp.]|nr:BTAD domain-containing putative transcriptional regulator [Miltoncostaea sp.]